MSCVLCPQTLTYSLISEMHKGCASCQKQLKQMLAGFRGVMLQTRPKKTLWNNTAGYTEWLDKLEETDGDTVNLRKKDDYVIQRCDLRDMKKIVGLPKFLPLEDQVFTAWINEGVKDEKIQEVLGLNYSQLFHVKTVIRRRLQKQMAYYHQVKKLAKEKTDE